MPAGVSAVNKGEREDMAKYSRLETFTSLIQTGLVPLFYHDNVEESAQAIQALLDGGVRCVEFTNRGDRAYVTFEKLIHHFRDDQRLILGVGTILDPATAALYMQLGANFIVSPIFDPEIAKICNRRMVAHIPGTGTTTEIIRAQEMGAEICKIFPGEQLGGPGFIKAVRGPLPWARLMPTGGVSPTQENVISWIDAGAVAVGMGSNLVNAALFKNQTYENLHQTVVEVLGWIREARIRNNFKI
jgi:2-dehydro-3-deoxyphosphogluconate aldolase / (4S)-4-hydroxy-2-oxoglutarate aldolase